MSEHGFSRPSVEQLVVQLALKSQKAYYCIHASDARLIAACQRGTTQKVHPFVYSYMFEAMPAATPEMT
eukprot:1655943-Pleurochrysis_carterae.AAC.1